MFMKKHDDQTQPQQDPANGQSGGKQVKSTELEQKITELEAALSAALEAKTKAEESERRALADYQNVVRRSQEEKSKITKLAGVDMVQAILLPLDHLYLAKEQLKDQGLNMVHQQFINALQSQGVQEVEALGHPFNEQKMEVIDKRPVTDPVQNNIVVAVTQRGYTMNGDVIRHAKVVIGVMNEEETHDEKNKKI
jgi:molecular chaperone GrpE